MLNFFNEFHQKTKYYFSAKKIRSSPDPKKFPDVWKTTYIKTYNRFECIILDDSLILDTSLDQIIKNRKTVRTGSASSVNIQQISSILRYSASEVDRDALDGRGRRALASAGARYPLEVYLVTLSKISGLDNGIYHYRPDIHGLEHISGLTVSQSLLEKLFVDPVADTFSFAIFITAVFERSYSKYQDRSYRYILLEAGAMGQAFQNVCTAINLKSLIFGGVYDNEVEKLLAIDGITESLINTVLVK